MSMNLNLTTNVITQGQSHSVQAGQIWRYMHPCCSVFGNIGMKKMEIWEYITIGSIQMGSLTVYVLQIIRHSNYSKQFLIKQLYW